MGVGRRMQHTVARLERRGVMYAILAAALFGVGTPFAKGLLGAIEPQVLAGFFYLGAGVGLSTIWVLRRKRRVALEAPLTRATLPWIVGAVIFGGILGPVCLLLGLTMTSSSSASLLLNLEGIFTVLIAWFVVREHVNRRTAGGMVLIIGASLLLSWHGHGVHDNALGYLYIAGACLCWAIDNNLTQQVSAHDPLQIAALKGWFAGGVNTVLGIWMGGQWPGVLMLVGALVVGFFCYGLSLSFFVLALRHLGTARTVSYFSMAPFIGATTGLLLWSEPVTLIFMLAATAMAVGVWLHLTEKHGHVHIHEPLAHAHQHVHDIHHRHRHDSGDPRGEPHTHLHRHKRMVHQHPHYPDLHHRHAHSS